jgi:hypothetical protein
VGECINLAVAPINLTATASSTEVTDIDLTWTDALGSALPTTQYEVYQAYVENGLYVLVGSEVTTSYTVENLQQDTLYWFKVVAVNSLSTSPPSEAASAVTGAIAPTPINVVATPLLTTPASIQVTWDEGTEYTPFETTHYEIYMATYDSPSTNHFTLIGTSQSKAFIIYDLDDDDDYYFRVRAVNDRATSPFSVQDQATTYPVIGLPQNVVATAQPTDLPSIKLTWDEGIGSGADDIVEIYNIVRIYGTTYTAVASTTGREFTDTNLLPQGRYSYSIAARWYTDKWYNSGGINSNYETTFNEYNGNQMGDNQMGDEQLGGRTL